MNHILSYRKYISSDFRSYYELVSQDAPMQYITGKGMTAEEAQIKFASILDINLSHPTLGYFQVLDSDSRQILGECKLVNYLKDPSIFEIGYLLKSEYWRKGFGSAICKHLLALAVDLEPEKDIVGIIDPQNEASKRLLEKFGFKSYFLGIEDGRPTEKLILNV